MGELSEKQKRLMQMVAASTHGEMDCYDENLDEFCDDEPIGNDTINQCFDAGWLRQLYDTSSDTGTVRITEAGKAALEADNG